MFDGMPIRRNGNCMIAQSGGPTAVINSTAYGCIKEFMAFNGTAAVYAGLYGMQGILEGKIRNVSSLPPSQVEFLPYMPSAAFGSSRYRLKDFRTDDREYQKLFQIFRKYNIRYFFYIGGNDSMDTADKIYDYAGLTGYDLSVCGIPKTIDNDLVLTDHCPGFGSAAKFVTAAVEDIWFDINAYQKTTVMVLEVMGRDTGWIAAAAGILPNVISGFNILVYVPEKAFDGPSFLADVSNALSRKSKLLVVVSEGLKDKKGEYVGLSGNQKDSFDHPQLGGVGKCLQRYLKKNLLNDVKLMQFGVLQRCSIHCVSETDQREAEMVGRQSVRYVMQGKNGFMTALERNEAAAGYVCGTKPVRLKDVCNRVKAVPQAWIGEGGKCNTVQLLRYMAPLIFDA